MKTDELKNLGLNEEQIKSVMAINGKDVEAVKSKLSIAEQDRDNAQANFEQAQADLESANNTLESLKGNKTPEEIEAEIQKYKDEAANTKATYEKELTRRDQTSWITAQLDTYGVKSPFARKSLIADVMDESNGLKWNAESGKFMGFDEYMKDAKEKDAGLYTTPEEQAQLDKDKEQQEKKPSFTDKIGGDGTSGGAERKPPKIF